MWGGLRKKLVNRVRKYGGGEIQDADVEDIVGDVLLGLIKILDDPKRKPEREVRPLMPYIVTAAKNRALTFMRKRHGRLFEAVGTLDDLPERRAEKNADWSWVGDVVATLPRDAVDLCLEEKGKVTSTTGNDIRLRNRIYKEKSRASARVRQAIQRAAKERGIRIVRVRPTEHTGTV